MDTTKWLKTILVWNIILKNSDSEGYKNEDVGDNESIVPDSDQDSSDIEVLSVGSSEVSSDHTHFGEKLDNNGRSTVNDATVTANANISNWTAKFTDITIEPFPQNSGPCLPENFGVSVATALDSFNILFKPEIYNNIKDHTNDYAIFKEEKFRETEIILTMLIVCGRKPQLKN